MHKKKVLSTRELEVEKILQEKLPEYVIRANVRLADVVHAGDQFKWMSGYHLDFVICDEHADVIAAVELDDSTHDTEDGQRRDANKNRWLENANIKLIRIRTKDEALKIRDLINQPAVPKLDLHKILSMKVADPVALEKRGWQKQRKVYPHKKNGNPLRAMAISIGLLLLMFWGFKLFTQSVVNKLSGNASAAIQLQNQKQREAIQKQQEELAWKQQQEREIAQVRKKIEAAQPHYERVLVKGKAARECSTEGVIDNVSIRCMKDHYEDILVGGVAGQ